MPANTTPQLIGINDEIQTKQTSKGKLFISLRKKLKSVFYIYSEASLAVVMFFGVLIELACGIALRYTEMPFLSPWAYGAAAILAAIAFALMYSVYRDLKNNPL